MDIGTWIVQIGGCLFAVGNFILLPVAYFVICRYFDNQLGLKKIDNPIADAMPFPFLFRTIVYCMLIVMHHGAKRSIVRFIYGDRDFRELARPIDKRIAFPFIVCLVGGVIIASVGLLIQLTLYLLSLF